MINSISQNLNNIKPRQNMSFMAQPSMPANISSNSVSTPKAHIVDENIFQATGSILKTYCDSAKDFYEAINGRGTDYSVGRLNDSAIRLGSLGIAAVVSTSLMSPFGRAMEFVGFASWFASMAIWPKYFIGTPLKMLTGIDFNQQYIDSYGRRKRFFEDPQYIPWNLMNEEQINKIGDKLKIPNDIQDRREHIQEKIKQIAIQANTLWMLTAGFATPIMSSLIANSFRILTRDITEKARVAFEEKEFNKITLAGKKLFDASTPVNNESLYRQLIVNPLGKGLAYIG